MVESLVNQADKELFLAGRPEDAPIGQWVKPLIDWKSLAPSRREPVVIYGCPDDTGIRRISGRPGAFAAPDSIRSYFYRFTMPMDLEWEKSISLWDQGNIRVSRDLEVTHARAQKQASLLAMHGATLLFLGGGHDFAAPNFLGLVQGSEQLSSKSKRFALINVDAHLDVRPLKKGKAHSGSPFRQIIDSGKLQGKDLLQFGIRPNRNARSNLAYCKHHRVNVMTFEQIRLHKLTSAQLYTRELKAMSRHNDFVVASFCMDACAEAEGTSAAPVLGFTAWEMVQMAYQAGRQRKVKLMEIMETSPPLDATHRSSRIAAEMIYFFLRGRAEAGMKTHQD